MQRYRGLKIRRPTFNAKCGI